MAENFIRTIRESRGMKVYELAEAIGCTSQHMSRMERGERNVNNERLSKIAEALDCTVGDLMDRQAKPVAIPFIGEVQGSTIVKDGLMPSAFSFDFSADDHMLTEVKQAGNGFSIGEHLICKRMDDPVHAINMMSVVKCIDSKDSIIGKLIEGTEQGTYTIINDANVTQNAKIEWAAPIMWKFQRVN